MNSAHGPCACAARSRSNATSCSAWWHSRSIKYSASRSSGPRRPERRPLRPREHRENSPRSMNFARGSYLDEFVFRYNRRFHRHASFEKLLGLTARHAPSSYWDIVGRANPRKGEATTRRAPRHRKTDYTIEIDDLKADRHKGYERVEEAITALMRAILTVKMPGGKTTRVQFLGGNDLDAPDRPAGVLTYSFDK